MMNMAGCTIRCPACRIYPGAAFPAANDVLDGSAEGFSFNVFGCRVPAIIVSPFIPPGSRVRPSSGSAPFDHTSIIKTVWECFNLLSLLSPASSLTERDAAAPSLVPFLSATANNNTGLYGGPTLQQTSTKSTRVAHKKTPQEMEALFKARLEKSVRVSATTSMNIWLPTPAVLGLSLPEVRSPMLI
jgi:hypothetical protein